jgi:hypothetical protein
MPKQITKAKETKQPKQPKPTVETRDVVDDQLLKINQNLQALHGEISVDAKVNGRLLQQVTLLIQAVSALNAKLK